MRPFLVSRLLDALTTFHTFDEDGGGSIDAQEIKTTMRAMGQKISDHELLSMIAIADPEDTGEIDFEHFCYVVLSISRIDFSKMIQAHIEKPVQVRACLALMIEMYNVSDSASNHRYRYAIRFRLATDASMLSNADI
jgi:hypothetical protein